MPRHTLNTSPAADEEVMEIRIQQNAGTKKAEVRKQFPNLPPKTFDNIWLGITKAGIFPK